MDKYSVHRILEECSITDYLEGRGIRPKRSSGGKSLYHCPIHEGDHEPSFVVYHKGSTNTPYENYFCFGCHSGTTIINLVSDLEKITTYQAYSKLLENVDIDQYQTSSYHISEMSSDEEFNEQSRDSEINRVHRSEVLYLTINTAIRMHLEDLGFDDQEMQEWEKLYLFIDKAAYRHNATELQRIYDFLTTGGFTQKVKEAKERELKQLRENPWKT